jgi:hypothetical protein
VWWLGVVGALAAQEVREEKDGAGQLVRRTTIEDGRILSETTWTYEGGAVVRTETKTPEGTTAETWSLERGLTREHTVAVDGAVTLRELFEYDGTRLVSKTSSNGAGTLEKILYRYDESGRLVETVVQAPDGTVLSRTSASWARPHVPITFGLTGGTGWATLADTFSASGGVAVGRKPDPAYYKLDPLEFGVAVSYAYARAQGLLTTSDLRASSALDFNEIWPRTTLFLFTTVAHNPVANLNVDVYVAPLGLKYTIVRPAPWSLDVSFAPVWNYRSINALAGTACGDELLTADTVCSTSRVRGSLRLRAGYEDDKVSLKERVEFLPDLAPQDFVENLDAASIFRNTLTLGLKVTSKITVSESLVITRDRTLASQFDCEGGDDNPACEGWSFENVANLSVSWSL